MMLSEITDAGQEPMVLTMARRHLAKKLRVSYAIRWPLHSPDDLTQVTGIDDTPHLQKWSQYPDGELVYTVSMFDQKQTTFAWTFDIKELESMDIAFMHGDPTHMVLYLPSMFN